MDNPADSRFRDWFNVSDSRGFDKGGGDGGLIGARMVDPIVDYKVLNKGVYYSLSLAYRSLIPRGQG